MEHDLADLALLLPSARKGWDDVDAPWQLRRIARLFDDNSNLSTRASIDNRRIADTLNTAAEMLEEKEEEEEEDKVTPVPASKVEVLVNAAKALWAVLDMPARDDLEVALHAVNDAAEIGDGGSVPDVDAPLAGGTIDDAVAGALAVFDSEFVHPEVWIRVAHRMLDRLEDHNIARDEIPRLAEEVERRIVRWLSRENGDTLRAAALRGLNAALDSGAVHLERKEG